MEKSSIVNRVAARFIQASKITLGPGREDTQNSAVLQKAKLKAKSNGDLESAILSAGFYAKKLKKTMFVFKGNSFMHAVWRASYKLGDYLDPINNTGDVVYSVTPELVISKHEVKRPPSPASK